MTLELGINTPTSGRGWASETAAAGSRMARQVATGRGDLGDVLRAYRGSGQPVLLVLANESRQTCPDPDQFVEWYASRYADLIDACQVWNEPDGQDGGSSATASAWFVDGLIERAAFFKIDNPACKIIGPGLVSGQPQWLDGLQNIGLLDAISVHPYWKPAGELRGFLDGYRQHGHDLPIWLTEFDLRLDFVRAAAAIPYVEVAIPYCWQRWPGWPHAMVDEQGRPLPLLDVFKQAAKEIDMAMTAEETKRLADAENRNALTIDLVARTLKGNWDQGPESAEALLRAISPEKYGNFEAATFPK